MHTAAAQLVEDVSQLASPPEVYYELERLIGTQSSSLDDIAAVIRTDPDLTARLLQIANSAFYGYPAKIESVARALATIGTRQLRDLVLATTVLRVFSQIPFELVDMHRFWRHAMQAGLLARSLANLLGEPNDERFYVVGLLHDIGMLVLYLKLPDKAHEILLRAKEQRCSQQQVEIDELGYDHGELGAALLQSWRLPAAIIEPVRCHHSPLNACEYPVEAGLVFLASDMLSVEPEAEDGWPTAEAQRVLAHFGVEAEQCVEARAQADLQLEEMLALFALK